MSKVIISPGFGERVDLRKRARELMAQVGRDLGIAPEWAAVTHHNTEHPRVHVALRVGADKHRARATITVMTTPAVLVMGAAQ